MSESFDKMMKLMFWCFGSCFIICHCESFIPSFGIPSTTLQCDENYFYDIWSQKRQLMFFLIRFLHLHADLICILVVLCRSWLLMALLTSDDAQLWIILFLKVNRTREGSFFFFFLRDYSVCRKDQYHVHLRNIDVIIALQIFLLL